MTQSGSQLNCLWITPTITEAVSFWDTIRNQLCDLRSRGNWQLPLILPLLGSTRLPILDSKTLLICITEGAKCSGKRHVSVAKIWLFGLHSACSSVQDQNGGAT